MIVQSAPRGEPHFVVAMQDHTALAGQFARAFGNQQFEPVEPADIVIDMVDNHDRGWAEWDAAPESDPLTWLPYSLARTPGEAVLRTNVGSPDFNEERHPYAGLLSSMHSCGLYNGRFGLSDHIALDHIPGDNRTGVDAMLEGERRRQERLKILLAADPETAPWIEHDHLFQNYKQLQFFDTLALYFNMNHETERKTVSFLHVPLDAGRDTTLEITPLGDGKYGLSPYPFAGDPFEVSFPGRYLMPLKEVPDLAGTLAEIPVSRQTISLNPG